LGRNDSNLRALEKGSDMAKTLKEALKWQLWGKEQELKSIEGSMDVEKDRVVFLEKKKAGILVEMQRLKEKLKEQ